MFAATAVVTLALGIGAATAFYALADAVAFRPARAADLDGVYAISFEYLPPPESGAPPHGVRGLPGNLFRRLEAAYTRNIAAVASSTSATGLVEGPARAERLPLELVSGGYADLLRLSIHAGRWIDSTDDRPGQPPAAVISHRVWKTFFDGRDGVIGQPLRVSSAEHTLTFTVVGVAPAAFRGTRDVLEATDVWVPLGSWPDARRTLLVDTWVRAPQTHPETALREIERVIGPSAPFAGGLMTDLSLSSVAGRMNRRSLHLTGIFVLALAVLVFTAACANVANLMNARHTARQGEVAVRLTLGARPSRVVRLLASEAVVIAVAAAGLGLAMALAGVEAFGKAFPEPHLDPRTRLVLDFSPEYRVFIAAVAGGVLSAAIVAATSVGLALRVPLHGQLAGGAAQGLTGRKPLRRIAVAVQVTAALVLVMGASLALQNLHVAMARRLLFDADRVLTVQIHREYDNDVTRTHRFYEELERRLRDLPGIEASALSSALPVPIVARPGWTNVYAEPPAQGLAGPPHRVDVLTVAATPAYFDAMDSVVTAGRGIGPGDVAGSPMVAVVSESVAGALWPGQTALGKRLILGLGDPVMVVGITPDPATSNGYLDAGDWRFVANSVVVPLAQWWRPPRLALLRSREPLALVDPVRSLVRELDDKAAVVGASTLEAALTASLGPIRGLSFLIGTLAAVALSIALLGVYGVLSYLVSLRTREFGIRLALGARPGQVARLVFDNALHVILVGLLAGVTVAALVSRALQNWLVTVVPSPLAIWFQVPVLMLVVGLLAAYLPARRAARVDPNVALREQ
jgi:predicted permease